MLPNAILQNLLTEGGVSGEGCGILEQSTLQTLTYLSNCVCILVLIQTLVIPFVLAVSSLVLFICYMVGKTE